MEDGEAGDEPQDEAEDEAEDELLALVEVSKKPKRRASTRTLSKQISRDDVMIFLEVC